MTQVFLLVKVTLIMMQHKFTGLSNEKFEPPYTTNKILSPKLAWMNNSRIRLKFEGSCLKQEDTAPFSPNDIVNLFTIDELDSWPSDLNTNFALDDYLFGFAKLINGIGFDTRGYHSLPDGSIGKNVIILGTDTSSSVHTDNKGKDIFILGKGSTEG